MELENIAARADQFEKETAEANQFKKPEESAKEGVVQLDPLEAAGNRAEALLRILGVGAQAFIDNRLELPDDEILQGRASLAPVIEKYGLAGDGGVIPYQEEITAGFYLGGLWRRFRRVLAELRAADKAEAEKKKREQESSGSQRKHQPEEPARPVSGEVRIREEPDADKEGWSSE
jgi:hypothetical protein